MGRHMQRGLRALGCCVLAAAFPALAAMAVLQVEPAAEDAATLRTLVQQSLQHDARVRQGQAGLQASRQDVEAARSGLWPQLEFNANSRGVGPDGVDSSTLPTRVGAALSYTVHDFGRVRRQIEGRSYLAQAAALQLQQSGDDVIRETVTAWLQLLRFERLIAVQEQHVGELAALTELLAEIVATMPGRRSELTQAQTRLGQARDALHELRTRRREQALALQRLTGQPVLPDPAGAAWPRMPTPALEPLLAQALEQQPLAQAARHEAAALRAQAAETRAAQLPRLDLQLARNASPDLATRTPMQLYLGLRWTAFQGGLGEAQQLALLARAQVAEDRAAQLQAELEQRLRSAWNEAQAGEQRSVQLLQLSTLTDQVRRDYRAQWRELGRRSLLELLSAENEHLSTRTNQIHSEMQALQARVQLLHEAGLLGAWIAAPAAAAQPPGAAAIFAHPLAPATAISWNVELP